MFPLVSCAQADRLEKSMAASSTISEDVLIFV
jgi:hypothetical protein